MLAGEIKGVLVHVNAVEMVFYQTDKLGYLGDKYLREWGASRITSTSGCCGRATSYGATARRSTAVGGPPLELRYDASRSLVDPTSIDVSHGTSSHSTRENSRQSTTSSSFAAP